jgi:hypothetical protein
MAGAGLQRCSSHMKIRRSYGYETMDVLGVDFGRQWLLKCPFPGDKIVRMARESSKMDRGALEATEEREAEGNIKWRCAIRKIH